MVKNPKQTGHVFLRLFTWNHPSTLSIRISYCVLLTILFSVDNILCSPHYTI